MRRLQNSEKFFAPKEPKGALSRELKVAPKSLLLRKIPRKYNKDADLLRKVFFRAENRPKIDPNVLKMDFKTHRKFTFGLSVVVMAYSFDAFCWLKQQHQQKIKGTLRI